MERAEHADVGCCGGALFYPDGKDQMCFGNFPTMLEAVSLFGFYLLYRDYFSKHICSGVVNYSPENKIVDYINGADMFIRRSALEKTGNFDPEFFMYFEETELSFRLKKAGYKSVIIPEAQIVHLEGASQEKGPYFNFKKIGMYEYSRNLFFKKCHGNFYATIIKSILVSRNLVLFVLKGKSGYLKKARIIAFT
jgi:GT2 family glycosyltransferase